MLKQAFINAISEKNLKPIEVKELGITVYIGPWTAAEKAKIQSYLTRIEGKDINIENESIFNSMIIFCQKGLKDKDGNRIFSDSKEDYNVLAKTDGRVIERLGLEIMRLNGDLEEEPIDNAAKN